MGEYDTTANPDCQLKSGFNLCNDPHVDVGVEETFVHPGYRDNSNDRYDDIALVKLVSDVEYTGIFCCLFSNLFIYCLCIF